MDEFYLHWPRQCGKSKLVQDVYDWQQDMKMTNGVVKLKPNHTKLTFYYANGRTFTATGVLNYDTNIVSGVYLYSRVKNSMITENVRVPTEDVLAIDIRKPNGNIEILRNNAFEVVVDTYVSTGRQKIKRNNLDDAAWREIMKGALGAVNMGDITNREDAEEQSINHMLNRSKPSKN
jgi:hypothetical protein